MLRRYEQPWRPAYEVISAIAWFGGSAFFMLQAFKSLANRQPDVWPVGGVHGHVPVRAKRH
jgi:hypothetical protein